MGDVPKYKVLETIAMGEIWWNVVLNIAIPDSEIDDRYVYGTFTKARKHAEAFCMIMNNEYKQSFFEMLGRG